MIKIFALGAPKPKKRRLTMNWKCDILDSTSQTRAFLFSNAVTQRNTLRANCPLSGGQTSCCLASHLQHLDRGHFVFSPHKQQDRQTRQRQPAPGHHGKGATAMVTENIPRTPDSGQDLPPELLNRIRIAAQDPTGRSVVALIRQLCPGLTPAVALEWIRDSAFEAEAVRQAAELLNGEWSQEN